MHFFHNQVQLTGRVAADPELYFTSDGTPKASLTLLQDRTGERHGPPARFALVGWEALARRLHELLRQDDRIFVQGQLRIRTYERDGTVHQRAEIHLEQYVLLKSPRSSYRLLKARTQKVAG